MEVGSWRHFYHGADIGIEGCGSSPAAAFEQAALGLTAVICDPARVRALTAVTLDCSAPDRELLLVDWLNGLIFEMATRRMLFCRFAVELEGEHLHGRAWGEAIEVARHHPAVEVKGATYTQLRVSQQADGQWLARCVVDV